MKVDAIEKKKKIIKISHSNLNQDLIVPFVMLNFIDRREISKKIILREINCHFERFFFFFKKNN